MKIDIHTHTKKIKKGEAETRNIDAKGFGDAVRNTDVRILAITNHNHFDYAQYIEFKEEVKDYCQIWPGIELNVRDKMGSGHMLLIVNPIDAEEFDKVIKSNVAERSEDKYSIEVDMLVEIFGKFNPLYIPHFHGKKPALSDETINRLSELVSKKERILKEASNSISAGVYIAHGHHSIYGSDTHDWSKYAEEAKDLPELRLSVESFEQFCLLLEKNEPAIQTLLSAKSSEILELEPFKGERESIKIRLYNDINIIFGSKGTGKTEILEKIEDSYRKLGLKVNVFRTNDEHLNDHYNLDCKNESINLSKYCIDDCKSDISVLRTAGEVDITNISKYLIFFQNNTTNAKASRLRIKDTPLHEHPISYTNFETASKAKAKLSEFIDFVKNDPFLSTSTNNVEIEILVEKLEHLHSIASNEENQRYIDVKSLELLHHLVKQVGEQISNNVGTPSKPSSTGLLAYAKNRIKIELAVNKIIDATKASVPCKKEYVGKLGEKGDLYCVTEYRIPNKTPKNPTEYKTLGKNATKKSQTTFLKALKNVKNNIYSDNLFDTLLKLSCEDSSKIEMISDLIQVNRHFAINGKPYKPSSGESSMVLLHKELSGDKEIFILDEPEKSLGNDYISNEIVPRLKQLANMGKKIIIATHDANIAVRTLPYTSIYRSHDNNEYYTYTGNPFSNFLICSRDSSNKLNWKDVSMKTLEGGREAFGERGKIYGENKS